MIIREIFIRNVITLQICWDAKIIDNKIDNKIISRLHERFYKDVCKEITSGVKLATRSK